MNFEVVRPDNFPLGRLPFSPAIASNGFLFVSGQASTDELGQIVSDTFAGEFRRTMDNIKKILDARGLSLANVVQVRSYVQNSDYLGEYNQLYKEYFKPPYPARTTLVNCLGTAIKFEMDVVAAEGG